MDIDFFSLQAGIGLGFAIGILAGMAIMYFMIRWG